MNSASTPSGTKRILHPSSPKQIRLKQINPSQVREEIHFEEGMNQWIWHQRPVVFVELVGVVTAVLECQDPPGRRQVTVCDNLRARFGVRVEIWAQQVKLIPERGMQIRAIGRMGICENECCLLAHRMRQTDSHELELLKFLIAGKQ
ncbi:hypothetical protein PAPYR_8722 [Paratrimastix pyriformis]|uniref:Uncharacterized protein n=1 Tax=Paratrimastix pyriformis TaxID=342808 RepID=A0ABQ8UCL6_9EUKA|nr:hypothetical protein PAPYR_8722 [Paratrimastix pyriformis]